MKTLELSFKDICRFGKLGVLSALCSSVMMPLLSAHAISPAPQLTAKTPEAEIPAPADVKKGFTIRVNLDMDKLASEGPLLDIPGVVSFVFKENAVSDTQNYASFRLPDGSSPVLEATLLLESHHADWKQMTIGVPLGILSEKDRHGAHEICLHFTGPHWKLFFDGELMDQDFPFGYPRWGQANVKAVINAACVSCAVFSAPATIPLPGEKPREEKIREIQYWTPQGHNAWVGDVATFYHEGRLHVFYLFDRRHHRSRFGTGAHYFEHLSTKDFKTWVQHEEAVPIDEQRESVGTGSPFAYEGRLHIAYGLHTTRLYPDDQTITPLMIQALKKDGKTSAFAASETPGVPSGATYASSDDGAHFKKSGIFFHPCENPTVYHDPNGELRLLPNNRHGGGLWASEELDRGWHDIDPDAPSGGDCTFFFRWGGYDYIIGGFRSLYNKPIDGSEYVDLAGEGLDIYDGLNVPAVSEIGDGRFIMTGWTGGLGWGGHLVLRELIQFPDGRLGAKWMEEVTPKTKRAKIVKDTVTGTETIALPDTDSFMLTFDVTAEDVGAGRFAVSFFNQDGAGASCEFQLNLKNGRAQWNSAQPNGFAPADQKTLREGGKPREARDYAIEKLRGVDEPFQVRMLVKHNPKMSGSLVDVEIAGQRTMLTCRPGLRAGKLVFRTESIALENVRISPLK